MSQDEIRPPTNSEIPLCPLDLACDHVQAAREQLSCVHSLLSESPLRTAVHDAALRRLAFVDESLEHLTVALEIEAERLRVRAALEKRFSLRPPTR